MSYYREAAKRGYVEAMYCLGLCPKKHFHTGHGVAWDKIESAGWFRKAADREFPPAQRELGTSYFFGTGVPVSWEEAVKWYQKAMKNGDVIALRLLGECYEDGLGVPQQ